MGLISSIVGGIGSALGSKGGQAVIGAAGDILGGVASSAMGYYNSKKMAKYNYDLQMQGYKQFPSAQVEGLKKAGINPMVAYGGIAGAQAHAQNYVPGQMSNVGSSAISRYQQAKQNELAEKNLTSQIDVNSATAEKARKEGDAAMMNAETNRMSVDKMAPNDPNNSGWAKGSYITNNLGNLISSGFGAKMLYDWWKKSSTNNTVGQSKNQYIKPSNGGSNTIIKPITPKSTSTSTPKTKLSIKRPSTNSAASVKAAAPIIVGEVLDAMNSKLNPRAKKNKEKPINSWRDRVRWVD